MDFSRLAETSNQEMAFQELEFMARDGTPLFYRSIEGGQDVVFVLVHGSGLDGRYMLSLAKQLNGAARSISTPIAGASDYSFICPGPR